MKFNYPNAFSINLLGENSFPFSYEIEKEDENFIFSIYPIQLISIADIVEKYAEKFIVAFDVDHYWFDETKGFTNTFTLLEVAKTQKLDFIEYDQETIGFEKEFLNKLLADFGHYNFAFFDFAEKPTFEEIYDDYLICKAHDWKSGGNLLKKLNNSRLYVSSHDDCYLYLETKNLNSLKKIFVRTLQFLAATKDVQNRFSESELESFDEAIDLEIADLPSDVMNEIFSETKPITIFQENITIDEKTIRIPMSLKKFDFQKEQKYEIEGFLNYNFENNVWAVEMI